MIKMVINHRQKTKQKSIFATKSFSLSEKSRMRGKCTRHEMNFVASSLMEPVFSDSSESSPIQNPQCAVALCQWHNVMCWQM